VPASRCMMPASASHGSPPPAQRENLPKLAVSPCRAQTPRRTGCAPRCSRRTHAPPTSPSPAQVCRAVAAHTSCCSLGRGARVTHPSHPLRSPPDLAAARDPGAVKAGTHSPAHQLFAPSLTVTRPPSLTVTRPRTQGVSRTRRWVSCWRTSAGAPGARRCRAGASTSFASSASSRAWSRSAPASCPCRCVQAGGAHSHGHLRAPRPPPASPAAVRVALRTLPRTLRTRDGE
jgi:hypothetical protein